MQKTFFFAFAIFLFIGCRPNAVKHDTSRYIAETSRFGEYYKNTFNKLLPQKETTFIIVSSDGCGGCIEGLIKNIISHPKKDGYLFIISQKAVLRFNADDLKNNSSVLIDQQNAVDRLPFHKGNIAVISVSDKAIYNIKPIEPNEVSSVLEKINE